MHPGSDVRQSRASASDQTGLYVRSRPGPTPVTAILCDGLVCDGFIYKYLWDDLAERLSVAPVKQRLLLAEFEPAALDQMSLGAQLHLTRALVRNVTDRLALANVRLAR